MWRRATFAAAGVTIVAALAPAVAGGAPARSGSYEGVAYYAGEKPSPKEWVRFKVSSDGRSLKSFSTRLWMICYIGPPLYNQTLPTVIDAPRARISASGRVDHDWREPYEVDGESYELEGHLALRFRRGKAVTGKIRVAFADCGTTTGDPPRHMRIRAKRSR